MTSKTEQLAVENTTLCVDKIVQGLLGLAYIAAAYADEPAVEMRRLGEKMVAQIQPLLQIFRTGMRTYRTVLDEDGEEEGFNDFVNQVVSQALDQLYRWADEVQHIVDRHNANAPWAGDR